jgi:diamine N-acetyltransferase
MRLPELAVASNPGVTYRERSDVNGTVGFGTARLRFRAVERGDLPALERWLNDFGTLRTAGIGVLPLSRDGVEHWYARLAGAESGEHWVVIVERATGTAIGFAGLRDIDHRHGTAEYAITIGEPTARGRGYGTEATRRLLDYAFADLGLRSVLLDVSEYNLAGRRAYARAGFREIGRRRETDPLAGRWWDTIFMEARRG